MYSKEKKAIIKLYTAALKKHGMNMKSLMCTKGRQSFEFAFLSQIDGFTKKDSILDVGCGFGDLEPYLRKKGWEGYYCGVDITEGIIEIGKKKNPTANIKVSDIQTDTYSDNYDWVFCSGALNISTGATNATEHFNSMITSMFSIAQKGVSVNMFSPFVDYRSKNCYYPTFNEVMLLINGLTKRFTIRHDYMPYEMTLYLYKEDEINLKTNTFLNHDSFLYSGK